MPNHCDDDQHDYIIHNHTPPYNSENLEARVELLRDLPKTPMANFLFLSSQQEILFSFN